MEKFEHNPMSPAGQVDAWGDLADGLKHNRTGRRRALRMVAALVVVVLLFSAVASVLALLLT